MRVGDERNAKFRTLIQGIADTEVAEMDIAWGAVPGMPGNRPTGKQPGGEACCHTPGT